MIPIASASGWLRLYSNGTHVFTAMLIGLKYWLTTRDISEFNAINLTNVMNFTAPSTSSLKFMGKETIMTLKPTKVTLSSRRWKLYS